jgi:polysaccharide biosynthesis protein PslG
VSTVRMPFYWYELEPRPGQFEFARLDEVLGQAADRGIGVLPFVYGSPAWVSADQARPPLWSRSEESAWRTFLRRLVERYGPAGDFWSGRASQTPIRRWQIWNEPNFVLFWHPRPAPLAYAKLLRISAHSIRALDPAAKIVTAGVAPVEDGITPWAFLRHLYEVPGIRSDFDFVALNPYAPYVPWVGLQIGFVRDVMRNAGDDRTPLLLSELGVASDSAFPNPFAKGRRGQAAFLRRAIEMLVAKRRLFRIAGVDWYTWQDSAGADPHCVFCQFSGLLDRDGHPKPAWWAFQVLAQADPQLHRAIR